MEKWEYFERFEEEYPERIAYNCWLCEYAVGNKLACYNCPLDWGETIEEIRNHIQPQCSRNAYGGWCRLGHYQWQEAARLAREIAELKEME